MPWVAGRTTSLPGPAMPASSPIQVHLAMPRLDIGANHGSCDVGRRQLEGMSTCELRPGNTGSSPSRSTHRGPSTPARSSHCRAIARATSHVPQCAKPTPGKRWPRNTNGSPVGAESGKIRRVFFRDPHCPKSYRPTLSGSGMPQIRSHMENENGGLPNRMPHSFERRSPISVVAPSRPVASFVSWAAIREVSPQFLPPNTRNRVTGRYRLTYECTQWKTHPIRRFSIHTPTFRSMLLIPWEEAPSRAGPGRLATRTGLRRRTVSKAG
jgi:hypothetical protein